MIPYKIERPIRAAIKEQERNPSRSIIACLEDQLIINQISFETVRPFLKYFKEFNLPVSI